MDRATPPARAGRCAWCGRARGARCWPTNAPPRWPATAPCWSPKRRRDASCNWRRKARPGSAGWNTASIADSFAPGQLPRSLRRLPGAGPDLVFTGNMDYWPNADAVIWFAREVHAGAAAHAGPELRFRDRRRQSRRRGAAAGPLPGVHVTGRVADVRPYLAHAALAVAPLRIARGIQNKVLEAMAMGKPVVASPARLRGHPRRARARPAGRPTAWRKRCAACWKCSTGSMPGSGAAGARAHRGAAIPGRPGWRGWTASWPPASRRGRRQPP